MKLFSVLHNVGKFRTAFDFGGREVAHWFPGHMAKGDCSFPYVLTVRPVSVRAALLILWSVSCETAYTLLFL